MAKKTTTKKRKARAAKDKVLAHTLYTYVKPANGKWVRREAAKRGVSYSVFVDSMIETFRDSQKAA